MNKEREALKMALEALQKCDSALAEELAAWDIDPPLHHVQEASNACGPAITALRKALAEQPAQQWNAGVPSLYPEPEHGVSIKVEYEQPEFFTHNVEDPYDWSTWVCPDPKSYLMKCCDCGLVHEAQFGVVRYKSETEREDCDMVDDPNLQAVFRMRRSEQWSPADTAHRAGGLPMAEQPAQQPRQWQGLTDEERHACTQSPFSADNYRAIEAKLKEKNNG